MYIVTNNTLILYPIMNVYSCACIVNININTDTAYKHILVNYDNMLMIHVSSANVYIVANNQMYLLLVCYKFTQPHRK